MQDSQTNVNELVFLKEILSTIPPIDIGRRPGVPAKRVVTGLRPVQAGTEPPSTRVLGTSNHGNAAHRPVSRRQADSAAEGTETAHKQVMHKAGSPSARNPARR